MERCVFKILILLGLVMASAVWASPQTKAEDELGQVSDEFKKSQGRLYKEITDNRKDLAYYQKEVRELQDAVNRNIGYANNPGSTPTQVKAVQSLQDELEIQKKNLERATGYHSGLMKTWKEKSAAYEKKFGTPKPAASTAATPAVPPPLPKEVSGVNSVKLVKLMDVVEYNDLMADATVVRAKIRQLKLDTEWLKKELNKTLFGTYVDDAIKRLTASSLFCEQKDACIATGKPKQFTIQEINDKVFPSSPVKSAPAKAPAASPGKAVTD